MKEDRVRIVDNSTKGNSTMCPHCKKRCYYNQMSDWDNCPYCKKHLPSDVEREEEAQRNEEEMREPPLRERSRLMIGKKILQQREREEMVCKNCGNFRPSDKPDKCQCGCYLTGGRARVKCSCGCIWHNQKESCPKCNKPLRSRIEWVESKPVESKPVQTERPKLSEVLGLHTHTNRGNKEFIALIDEVGIEDAKVMIEWAEEKYNQIRSYFA